LLYGTGVLKQIWNPHLGKLLQHVEDGSIVPEGDIEVTVPNIWNIYLDGDATTVDDINHVFERLYVPFEEAINRWPEEKEMLVKMRQEKMEGDSTNLDHSSSILNKRKYDVIELFEYWEVGTPTNGFIGRYSICTFAGDVLELNENPERYRPISPTYETLMEEQAEDKVPLAKAVLPYQFLTDIDIPGTPWGRSTIEYASNLQSHLNKLDTTILQCVQAHGVARIIVTEGSEVDTSESISNSPWDIVKIKGSMPPHFMEPMPLPPAMNELRMSLKQGIDDMQGVNESMFGQQSREQSGFAMQYATNQGNMIRQRLFNKFIMDTELLHRRHLTIVANKWDNTRIIQVLGKENRFETKKFKGADISHGYDVIAEYGSSMSLDPITRRGEVMNMLPILEKAQIPPEQIIQMAQLGDTSSMVDTAKLADTRMQEYFDSIIKSGMPIAPREHEDHTKMLAYAGKFVMMRAYQDLPDMLKDLIDEHISERQALISEAAAPGEVPPEGAPAPEAPAEGGEGGAEELTADIMGLM
jgi:hypothetical protein